MSFIQQRQQEARENCTDRLLDDDYYRITPPVLDQIIASTIHATLERVREQIEELDSRGQLFNGTDSVSRVEALQTLNNLEE